MTQLDGNISLSSNASSSSSAATLAGDSFDSSFLPFSNIEPSYEDIFSQDSFSLMSSEDTSLTTSTLTAPEVMSAPAAPVYLPTSGTSSIRKKEETARILSNIIVTNQR